ncbi:T9SS type A sorting domain-containing protein [Flavobacterium beibuense]|uniref:PKD repeat protein n=1 Tax=Flavobacterium beibuense TaxID=657326 RepID=A0A444WGB2_9FLAO|nr:T9SS type A sorting domain-containing protein [Flavobacterium beibuense]RYJ44822.1 PKD repeat protein [Flavobacterium beibuense]
MKNALKLLFLAIFLIHVKLTAQNTMEPAWNYMADETNGDYAIDFWVNPLGDSYTLGNIGQVAGSSHPNAVMFVKTDNTGEEVWRNILYPVTTDWQLFARSVVGDEDGNVFVVYNESYKYTEMTNNRIVVAKFSPDGTQLWSQYYTEQQNGPIEEINHRSAIYKNGILYFTGISTDVEPSANLDGLIVKINGNSGELISKLVFNSQYNSDDVFRQIKVADNGEVWAIGRSRGYMMEGGIYSDYDANIVKYDAEGILVWEHRLNGTSNNVDHGINVDIDSEGNSYISSQLRVLGINQRRVYIQKLTHEGNVAWTYQYQGSSSGYNWDQPIKILPNNRIAFATSNENGIVLQCLSANNGTLLWQANYNRNDMGSANHQEDMIVDNDSNIYITGVSRDNTPMGAGYDMVTLKYSDNGELLSLYNFNYGDYSTTGDMGIKLLTDSPGNLYVLGNSSYGTNYNDDFVILKFGDASLEIPETVQLKFAVYPNPSDYYINVSGSNYIDSISLVDINGRIVKYIKPDSNSTIIDISNLSPAMYFIKIESEGLTTSYKIIKKQ